MNRYLYMLAIALLFAGCVKNDWRDPPRPFPIQEEVNIDDLPVEMRSAIQRQDPYGTITKVVACWLSDIHYGEHLTGYEVTSRSPLGTRTYILLPCGDGYICKLRDPQSPAGDSLKAAPEE